MSARKWVGVVVLAIGLAASTAGRCAAGGYVSQTRYLYDGFGNVRAVAVAIRTDHSAWWFIVPGAFLDLPVAVQATLLDRRYGFGIDAPVVGHVLLNMQQQLQQMLLQNQRLRLQNQLQQMQQLQNQLVQMQQLQNQLQLLNRPLFPQPIRPVMLPRIR
jgi:hypothetical protein